VYPNTFRPRGMSNEVRNSLITSASHSPELGDEVGMPVLIDKLIYFDKLIGSRTCQILSHGSGYDLPTLPMPLPI